MHIHILGICGTFMGGLAALAAQAGHRVTGCDAGVYPPMSDQLRAMGIDLIEGYGADQISLDPDLYVVGNVVSRAKLPDGRAKFPLMEAILNAGLPYTSGPQWLAEHVLQGCHVLAVAGTHGKTTTTAMLTWILECAGLTPGFLVGGVARNFGTSARLGTQAVGQDRPLFVIEADEYDTAFFDKRSKFVHYRPRTAILNNLEFDHADIFPDLSAIERQFAHLLRTIPDQGLIVSNATSEALERALAQGVWAPVARFAQSTNPAAAWQVLGPAHDFVVTFNGREMTRVEWALQGEHNQMNAVAAIAAAQHVGVSPAQSADALTRFENVKRRMELIAQVGEGTDAVWIYDDFAHHPSAIATTLAGLRERLDLTPSSRGARILAVFEPRSNTMKLGTMKALLPEALALAEVAVCHTGGLGWDAATVLAPMGARALCADTIDTTVAAVLAHVRPGDRVVCMSNGGFGGIHQRLRAALQAAL